MNVKRKWKLGRTLVLVRVQHRPMWPMGQWWPPRARVQGPRVCSGRGRQLQTCRLTKVTLQLFSCIGGQSTALRWSHAVATPDYLCTTGVTPLASVSTSCKSFHSKKQSGRLRREVLAPQVEPYPRHGPCLLWPTAIDGTPNSLSVVATVHQMEGSSRAEAQGAQLHNRFDLD